MSLINDALKKAQKLQNPQAETDPQASEPAARAHRRPAATGGFERMMLGVVALVVVLVGAAVVAVLVFRKEPAPRLASAPAAVPSTPPAVSTASPAAPAAAPAPRPAAPAEAGTAAPAATPPAPPPVQPATPASAAVVQTPFATPAPVEAGPSPAPAASAPAVAVSLAPPTALPASALEMPARTVQPRPPAAPPATQPATPEDVPYHRRVLAFIDRLHVTGVRAAGDDSKVLMNDRVYRMNDLVDIDLGIRIAGVSTTVLMFADENGRIYTKALQ